MVNHPCLSCGACCAYFRVSFHWSEILTVSHSVPEALTVKISPHQSAMLGTDQVRPVCVALKGKVGQSTSCSIYENRPECCRSFAASFENGLENLRCDQARVGQGLAALTLQDWQL